jgi:hypothetical protein
MVPMTCSKPPHQRHAVVLNGVAENAGSASPNAHCTDSWIDSEVAECFGHFAHIKYHLKLRKILSRKWAHFQIGISQ